MHSVASLPAVEIRARPLGQLAYLAGSIGFVIAGAWIAATPDFPTLHRAVGVASILFFGLCATLVLKNIVVARGRIVTLSTKGVTSHRFSPSVVPWEAITEFQVFISDRNRALEVHVTAEAWQRMRVARWVRLLTSRRASQHFPITAQTTGLSFEELEALVRWFHGTATGLPHTALAPPIDLARFAEPQPVA